ncbi:aldo/keto reductase [Cellulomonas wangsupingiae]|uniref:Aldo/keto reductase n=1 Tax=Cellulomonas wangsupingiae TaxID=2968085 RepID=A0ABY5K0E2_9CELL|nr:aldo/keto reductase [Cellulomonas wangsupingiae]MCC2333291.1 aldo/keto reductase [Cellulomonas wangsupingiae]MCM0638144.1 aldo/keto reductase [Cellulomonas wangsupingiae]UUI63495.1 aldo/keto reductase [Cellulomonas wangsupingiae]
MTSPTITLNNGVEIPQVGFGTFQVKPEQTQQTVEDALAAGYRHIDTAAGYYNEAGVGAAVRACGLPRDEVFVTTKLRNGDQGYEQALRAFEDSRAALGLDVVDLYLIHWPVPSKDLYVETWRAFEKLLADGAVRAIGVSNFLPDHLERLVRETDVVPAVNQVEVHPTFQQRPTQDASAQHGIAVEAYSPLGQGKDLESDAVTSVAERLGVTTGQVVLRWHVQAGRVVIPKSVTPERIRSNLDLFSFELTDDDVAAIDALETHTRIGADPATAAFSQMR